MSIPQRKRLLYVHPGPLTNVDGQFYLPTRTVSALREYSRRWNGPVAVTGHGMRQHEANAEDQSIAGETDFTLTVGEALDHTVRLVNPDVILALHHPSSAVLLKTGKPVVLTAEFSRSIRAGMALASTTGTTSRARVVAGSWRSERTYLSMIRRSAGVQANGPAAWKAYGRHNARGLMFHDHRITASDINAARQIKRDGEAVFRLAFSGRLINAKGAHLIIPIAKKLAHLAPTVEIKILGTGPWEPIIRKQNPGNIEILGFKDFRMAWIPYIRSDIDLMVLPHIQGDPSCTYFEAWGCGTPVIGFDNETLTNVVNDHACGWVAASGDVAGLALHIAQLSERPSEFMKARERGLDFLADHTFEIESERRIAMLRAVANR